MKQILIVVALVILNCVITPAQTKPENPQENADTEVILQVESEGREATLKNDIAANDRLLADNWLNINPDGSITTKARLLALLKDGSFKIMSIENDEVMVRVYGDAAVVTGRSTTKRTGSGGEVLARQVRFTRVYAKSKGQWQVVSAHNTLIAKS
jgi:ketosteroid isomerase-like protein